MPWYLPKEDAAWLKKLCADKRPEVSEAAQEGYAARFPYAQRNERKKQLHIKHMELSVNGDIGDEYGEWEVEAATFVLDKSTTAIRILSVDGEKTVSIGSEKMNRLLNRIINNYEVFCWTDDYDLGDPDDAESTWSIRIQYGNGEIQEIVSYEEIPDKLYELLDDLHTLIEDNEI